MEGRTKKGEEALRHERNGKSSYHFKAQCKLCHEREEVFVPTLSSVSNLTWYSETKSSRSDDVIGPKHQSLKDS